MSSRITLDSDTQAELLLTYFKMGRKKREDRLLMEMREKKVLSSLLGTQPNQDPGGVQDDVIKEIIDNSGVQK